MASFFGANPFASTLGRKIEQATDPSLPSENWALNMEICDLINETEDGAKDAMKAIRKRLTSTRNFNVMMYTLTVLETCVKNCHKKFIVLVCNKEFVQELVKLIGPKNDPPPAVQQKVLSLIQSWADAFRHQPELNGVVQVYNELKQKGIEFPMTDLDAMAPIYTPQASVPGGNSVKMTKTSEPSSASNPSSSLTPDQLGKLTSELRVVEGNMTVLSEMLSELVPGKEPPGDLELLKELYATCQAMQERLVELIGQLSNDEITAELLRVNDGLNNLFLRYSRYEKNRKSSSTEREKEAVGSLINLNDESCEQTNSVNSQLANLSLEGTRTASQLSSIPSVIAHNNKGDEFDMFAQSRNVTYESYKAGGSTYDANKEVTSLGKSLSTAAQSRNADSSSSPLTVPDLIGMHLEQDFVEMAAWLGEKQHPQQSQQPHQEESLTSSEFEKFLAERAAAAEALPSTLENNSSTSSSKTQKTPDSMFAL